MHWRMLSFRFLQKLWRHNDGSTERSCLRGFAVPTGPPVNLGG